MRRGEKAPVERRWRIDAFQTDGGDSPAWSFVEGLGGRDKVEALALIKLLEEQGNLLRRPQSGALADGLFELRGKQVRIFYAFLPGRVIVLLDGELKKRNDIPKGTMKRMRGLQADLMRRGVARRRREAER